MTFGLAESTSMDLAAPLGREPAERDSAVATAGLIHDLGNLIQLASSALRILGRSPDLQDGDLTSVIASAKTSLERAGSLVRDALGQARERGETHRIASPGACLAEIEAQMRIAALPDLRLDVRLEPDLPDIACDPIALQSAVLNLLFNARDAMAGRGVIDVTGEKAGPDFVELRIADHGVGMSRETIGRAFDPFFTTKCDGLGGIGLPMVERFVCTAGGELSLESELGTGTAVTMRLPAVRKGA